MIKPACAGFFVGDAFVRFELRLSIFGLLLSIFGDYSYMSKKFI